MTLLELQYILQEVGLPIVHYEARMTKSSYIVYRELGTSYSFASGRAWRETIRVSIDHFTKKEWDETLDKLKLVLLKNKINFSTVTMYYEDEKTIHTQFDLSIARDMRDDGE